MKIKKQKQIAISRQGARYEKRQGQNAMGTTEKLIFLGTSIDRILHSTLTQDKTNEKRSLFRSLIISRNENK